MKNQMTRECLYHSIKMEDELYHHGVLGMTWGERNGPPYPLTGENKEQADDIHKRRRQSKAYLKKVERKIKRERERIEKKKEKIVFSGKLQKLYRNRNLFTPEEFEEAKRMMLDIKAAKLSDQELTLRNLDVYNRSTQAVVGTTSALNGMAQLYKTTTDIAVRDIDRRNEDVKRRYDMLMKSDPASALSLYNTMYGTDYQYKGYKEASPLEKINALEKLRAAADKANDQERVDEIVAQMRTISSDF